MTTTVRYEPPEKPQLTLSLGLGLQQAALTCAGIIITPVIIIRAASGSESYLTWAVFGALLVSGVTTILQAVRAGPIGVGYPVVMGTSGAFIAVCVTAIADGGPAMLATLVVVSALGQFLLAARLEWLRHVITPTVAGTVVMLIAVTVMPIIFDQLKEVPPDVPWLAGPISAAVTLVVIAVLILRTSGQMRLWVPLIGLVVGCVVGASFGIYDFDRVAEADWIGFPTGWPGLDLGFDATFWALLPAFLFVTLIGAIETIGDASAVQGVAWRRPRATDFREVQGGVAADGVGNLLSGIAGTVPNTTYSSSIAIIELTGVAARRVGVWIGVFFIAMALVPKLAAVMLAIPGPVVAAYFIVLLAMLFVLGLRMVVKEGLDYRKSMIVGVSFWVGVGFQQQVIFADHLGEWWGSLLGNGMTSGGLTAMLLTGLLRLLSSRRQTIETTLSAHAPPAVDALMRSFAKRHGWGEDAAERLRSAGEESVQCLLASEDATAEGEAAAKERLLLVSISEDGSDVELEFTASHGDENVQDLLALLPETPENVEREVSFRLLRHYTSSVKHQQYHGTDILTVRVERGE